MDTDNILDDTTANPAAAGLVVDTPIQGFLAESAKWAKFMAILGFVFVGLAIIGILINMGATLVGGMDMGMGGLLTGFMLGYLVVIGIMVVPLIYLYNFANKMKVALRDNSQAVLRDAFENHKAMFKFYGIFTVVILVIYALAIVVGIGGAAMSLF